MIRSNNVPKLFASMLELSPNLASRGMERKSNATPWSMTMVRALPTAFCAAEVYQAGHPSLPCGRILLAPLVSAPPFRTPSNIQRSTLQVQPQPQPISHFQQFPFPPGPVSSSPVRRALSFPFPLFVEHPFREFFLGGRGFFFGGEFRLLPRLFHHFFRPLRAFSCPLTYMFFFEAIFLTFCRFLPNLHTPPPAARTVLGGPTISFTR